MMQISTRRQQRADDVPERRGHPGFPGGSAPIYQSITSGIKLVKVQESASSQTGFSPKTSCRDPDWILQTSFAEILLLQLLQGQRWLDSDL